MTVDAWVAIAGVVAIVLTAVAGLTKAIADLLAAWRRPDKAPAPEVGISAVAEQPDDDIDYRAYLDMKKRAEDAERALRDYLEARRIAAPDEDTHPI